MSQLFFFCFWSDNMIDDVRNRKPIQGPRVTFLKGLLGPPARFTISSPPHLLQSRVAEQSLGLERRDWIGERTATTALHCSPAAFLLIAGRPLFAPAARVFALQRTGDPALPVGSSQEPMVWGGLFLSLGRPTKEQQKSCLAAAGGFNYDAALHGATRPSASEAGSAETSDKALTERGYFVNRSRVLIGSGADTLFHAKSALLSWRHLALGWANVEVDTPVKVGARFCICYKEVIPWVMLPLQIAYVVSDGSSMLALGSGTLQGHLLAGEERFSVQVDEEDRVWYEVVSFSKPAHLLATLCYPYVQLRQRHFAKQSGQAILRHVNKHAPAPHSSARN